MLVNQQYNILFYDKGFIQVEYIISGSNFIDEDRFTEDFGVPIMLRIDYSPDDLVE